MKVLVTGGAGYIGSQTNLLLLKEGFTTIVFDSLEYGHREVVPADSVFVKGNLLNPKDINAVFENYKIDAVIHFAGYISVGESVENPQRYFTNNVVGTLNLLEATGKTGVNKIVFSSSAAVYGIPKKNPITEKTPLSPINPYGETKAIIEKILDDYFEAYGLSSVSLRYFNASGADLKLRTGEAHNPETHLIPLVLQAAAGLTPSVKVFGRDYKTADGTCIRDYIHVTDLASAHILALKQLLSGKKMNEKINLGVGRGYTVMEVIKKAKEVTGVDFKVKIAKRRPGDAVKLVADNKKAKKLLNWQPKYSDLETIITTAWKWLKKTEGQ